MGVPPVASVQRVNPCLSCGACCAYFRASFYWAEADDGGGTVPAELTTQISPFLRAMNGTLGREPRCVALHGTIGQATMCTIHPLRSSSCRDFVPSYEDGQHNPRCDAARAKHGLPPLAPAHWDVPVTSPDGIPGSAPGSGGASGDPGGSHEAGASWRGTR